MCTQQCTSESPPGPLGKTEKVPSISLINSERVSAHCICLLRAPSASICLIIQSAPFRGLDTIVHSKPGFPKATQLFCFLFFWVFCRCICSWAAVYSYTQPFLSTAFCMHSLVANSNVRLAILCLAVSVP